MQTTATTRLLQDIASLSKQLPTKAFLLGSELVNKTFLCRGGEATISTAFFVPASGIDGGLRNSFFTVPWSRRTGWVRVAVRDARLPVENENKGWNSVAGHRVRQQVRREALVYLQLRHPNIVPFLGVIAPESGPEWRPLSIVTLFAERGTAFDLLKETRRSKPKLFFNIVSNEGSSIIAESRKLNIIG